MREERWVLVRDATSASSSACIVGAIIMSLFENLHLIHRASTNPIYGPLLLRHLAALFRT